MNREQGLWYLSGLAWAAVGTVLAVFADRFPLGRAFLIIGSIAVSMLMAFRVPKGMFRGVREAPAPAKVGLGLLILLILAQIITVAWLITESVLSQNE